MKKLLVILIVFFVLFSCTEGTQSGGGSDSSGSGDISFFPTKPSLNEKVQIFPIQESFAMKFLKGISFGSKMCAVMPVEPQKALDDWDAGCMYAENSFDFLTSVKYQEINYLDVGAEYGVKQQLFVNVQFEVIEYSENANPIQVYVRAKGSSSAWTVLTPTLETPDNAIVATDSEGVLEWYANNTSYYDWVDENAEPGVHVYGHQTIIGYSDGASGTL